MVFLAVAIAVALSWTVAKQLTTVVEQIPNYQQNISDKIEVLRGAPAQALEKAANAVNEVGERLSSPPDGGSLNPAMRTRDRRNKMPLNHLFGSRWSKRRRCLQTRCRTLSAFC